MYIENQPSRIAMALINAGDYALLAENHSPKPHTYIRRTGIDYARDIQ